MGLYLRSLGYEIMWHLIEDSLVVLDMLVVKTQWYINYTLG